LTENVHARRTQLFLERAFGAHVIVGVIAALGRSLNHAVRVDPNVQPRRLLGRRLQAVIRFRKPNCHRDRLRDYDAQLHRGLYDTELNWCPLMCYTAPGT
jgi:hypothetical protein